MAPLTKYKPITSAVALLLKAKEHTRRLYNLKDVANQLQIAADAESNDNISVDFDALVAKAFVNKGNPDRYPLSYEHYFGYRRDKHVLCVVRLRESNSSGSGVRITAIGHFHTIEEAQRAEIVRWNVGLEEEATTTMVALLEEETEKLNAEKEEKEKASSKRPATDDISSEASPSKKQKTHLTEEEVQALIDGKSAFIEDAEKQIAAVKATVANAKAQLRGNAPDESLQKKIDQYLAWIKDSEEKFLLQRLS